MVRVSGCDALEHVQSLLLGDYPREEVLAIAKAHLVMGKKDLRLLGSFSLDKAYYCVMALGASLELLVWTTDVQGGRIVH